MRVKVAKVGNKMKPKVVVLLPFLYAETNIRLILLYLYALKYN